MAGLSPDALREQVRGSVALPGDADYDDARTVVMGGIEALPAAVVRVSSADDVRATLAFAQQNDLEVAVRSGGHSGAGHSVSNGIVIDVRGLDRLDIDISARTAWAGAGVTAGSFTRAAAEHGLATSFGDTGSVGLSGITLGGGVGLLSRKLGLTIDSLLAVELITADGEVHLVDAQSEPDLFWAVRGGGGNFGVVTRLQFALHDVSSFYGGMLFLPATPEVVRGMVRLSQSAPRELTTIVNVMPCPPIPFVPAEAHGSLVVMAFIAYAGDVADGERVVADFRGLATPLADMVRPMSYAEMFHPDDPSYHPIATARTLYADGIDDTAVSRALGWLESCDAAMRVVQFRALGGAIADVPNDATAYAHRDAAFMLNVATLNGSVEEARGRVAEVEALAGELAGGRTGAYVNFLTDEGPERVRQAYPGGTWDRLAEVKRRYDPHNVFRRNQNIPPGS